MLVEGTRVVRIRCCGMPMFQITVANGEFDATIEQELPDHDAAKAQALRGALELASEQVAAGLPFFAAEVTVAAAEMRERFIVAVGVSALK